VLVKIQQKLTKMMLISIVDGFGEKLRMRLVAASKGGWGLPFVFDKAPKSEFWRAKIGKNRNWIQLNESTYNHPSYKSKDNAGVDRQWKIQARFQSSPLSNIWVKKAPYIHIGRHLNGL
jgi:hypothetical protein